MAGFSLKGKIALVTGASHGVGLGIATGLAKAGAEICFNSTAEERAAIGLAAYKERGIDAHAYVCDVTDERQVRELVSTIEKEVGVIDILAYLGKQP